MSRSWLDGWLRLATPLVLALLLATTGSSPSHAADLEVGPFALQESLADEGWAPAPVHRVNPALEIEGVTEEAQVLLVSPKGSRIYGMFWESEDAAITAEKILPHAVPQSWFEDWGLEGDVVETRLQTVASGPAGVRIDASGGGTGKWFERGGSTPTVGTWLFIPVVFEDGERLRSGLVRLYFRASSSAASSGDRQDFERFVEGMRVRSATPIRDPKDFYSFLAEKERSKRNGLIGRSSAQVPGANRLGSGSDDTATQDSLTEAQRLLGIATSHEATKLKERADALQRLSAMFPANLPLLEEARRVRLQLEERSTVERLLESDADGANAETLAEFHRSVLEWLRQRDGLHGVRRYLAYLSVVWPSNEIVRPPADAKASEKWVFPLLGVEMVRIGDPSGGSWVSTGSMRQMSRAAGTSTGPLRDATSWKSIRTALLELGLSLPTAEQYRAVASQLDGVPPGEYWAEGPAGREGPSAIRVTKTSTGPEVQALEGRKLKRLSHADFFLVVPAGR